MEVGNITARLGGLFDDDAFDRFDRAIDKAKRATNDVKPTPLKGDYDGAAFGKYDRALKDADRSQSKLSQGAGRAFGSVKTYAAIGLGAATAGAAAFAKSSVDAFSEVNESMSKNRVLFGKHAKEVEDFAKTSAAQFGISRRAALEYTGVFGNLARAMGTPREEAAKTSVKLTKLAADMASFNNTSIEEALDALRSGLVGESEPLRRFGVTLSANAVAVEAMRSGIIKVKKESYEYRVATLAVDKAQQSVNEAIAKNGKNSLEARDATLGLEKANQDLVKAAQGGKVELSNQQKAQAIMALTLRQTSAAQGDAVKTGDQYAGQQKRMKAQLDDLRVSLGERLLPVQLKVTRAVTKFVGEIQSGKGAGGRFAETAKDIAKVIGEVGGKFFNAAKDVGSFFARHDDLLKVAATMAGIAASAKVLKGLGNLTGITGLLKLSTGLGKGGLLGGLASSAKPVPVVVVNGGVPGTPPGGGGRKVPPIVGTGLKILRRAAAPAVAAEALINPDSAGQSPKDERADLARIKVWREAWEGLTKAIGRAKSSGGDLGPISKALKTLNRDGQINASGLEHFRKKIREIRDERGLDLAAGRVAALRERLAGLDRGTAAYRQTARQLSQAQGDLNEKLGNGPRGRVEALRRELGHLNKGSDAYKATARRLKDAQADLNRKMVDAEPAGRRGGKGVQTIGDGAGSAATAVGRAAKSIRDNVNGLSKKLGGQGVSFTPNVPVIGGGARLASGGWIGSRGQAGRDEVPAMLGVGEAVLNRHQQAVVEGLLGQGFLDRLFSRVQKPHYLATGGRVPNVTIQGPAGGYRSAAQGGSDWMDKAAEKYVSKLTPDAVSGGTAAGLVAQVRRAIAWAQANGWGGSYSGMRSYAEQVRLYNELGPRYAAVPGTSNHGKGTAIDVTDPEGFARAMASAPSGSRLRRGMSWEPWHFSITGFAKGGWAKSARKTAGRASKLTRGYDDRLAELERIYGQEERARARNDKDFIVENDDGTTSIHQGRLDDQTDDLGILKTQRQAIRRKIKEFIKKANAASGMYTLAAGRMTRAIKPLLRKPKKHAATIARYKGMRSEYRSLADELKAKAKDLGYDSIDAKMDVNDLSDAIKALDPKNIQLDTEPDPVDAPSAPGLDLPSDSGTTPDVGAPDPVQLAPSAEEIAQGVAQQLAAFNSGRADLFASFGQNFARSGSNPFGTDTQLAAGARFFGAASGDDGPLGSAGGGVVVTNNYAAPPPDPHTWSQSLAWEVRQAV